MSPALERWGPPKRQGLCSHPAHLWATSHYVPRSGALGTPEVARVGGGGSGGQGSSITLHIITGHFNDPHNAISINNAEHIVHKTQTHWDEGHIGKRTSVLPVGPQPPNLKVHFRRSSRVFRPPPPHSKARRPPPSTAWKAHRLERNLPWPLP